MPISPSRKINHYPSQSLPLPEILPPRIEPFKASDILEITLREHDLKLVSSIDPVPLAEFYERNGPAFTYKRGDQIMACAGMFKMWPGVGQAWALTSNLVEEYPLWFHRTFKRNLNTVIQQCGFHRTQVTVMESHTKSIRWVESLGFVREGLMLKYDANKESHYLYSRTI